MEQQTLISAIQAFDLECQLKRLRPRTIQFYENGLKQFSKFCAENNVTFLYDASRILKLFNKNLLSKSYSAQYQHNILRAIRAFFKFCVDEDLLEKYPKITFPRVPKQVKSALSMEEVKRVLSVCDYRDKLIIK